MSTTTPGVQARATGPPRGSLVAAARAYFASDSRRTIQTVLGLLWLLDGGLQFQSFMYGKGFIAFLTNLAAGQPHWVSTSVTWGANTLHSDQLLFNTLFALVQVAIGVGLLYRPTVKPALLASFGWVLVVWWFGEAFGMLFMATTAMGGAPMASALTGAPGAVLLYALIGAIVWPNGRPGGLLGVRGARAVWAGLWLYMAYLWLVEAGGANGITNAINLAPSGMSWLSTVQNWFATAAKGNGFVIAVVLAAVSAAIGLAVAANWRPKQFLALAVGLSLLYWVVGQGFGGIPQGGATDPNAGLLFVVLAYALYTLVPYRTRTEAIAETKVVPRREVSA
ncbi:MAG: hypothetical protein JO321_11575 [Solirubrobacterales bacterium]|nr:hypothetical protein [Solirubrobacterales bacterium]MBV8941514.1 hypothetical protein [Solirubrobacterales bacterium]MBV9536038.1 hypothetical protein [Solirubrobacterales bacterium]